MNMDILLPAAAVIAAALYGYFFLMRIDAAPEERGIVTFWRDVFIFLAAAVALRQFFRLFPTLEPDHLFFGIVVFSAFFYGLYAFLRRGEPPEKRKAVLFWRDMFWCFVFIFLLRGFFWDYFRIPSNSMLPTLQVGDVVLTDKNAYGYRLPVLGTRLTDGDAPERGDIIVFRKPGDGIFYIKRILGVPGDELRYDGGKTVFINGEALPQTDAEQIAAGLALKQEEILERGWHDIFVTGSSNFFIRTPDAVYCKIERTSEDDSLICSVPPAHYFVLGDNRDRSHDSRFWGFVARDKIVGPARVILFNYHHFTRFWRSLSLWETPAPQRE